MIITRTRGVGLALITVLVVLVVATSAQAVAPVKLVLSSHLGWEVDKALKGQVCTVASKDECQSGQIGRAHV